MENILEGNFEQTSFFEEEPQREEFKEKAPAQNKYLSSLSEPVSVSCSKTISTNEERTPMEIFSGFDVMRIVTFSYSLKWLEALLACIPFKHVEIIYGTSYMVGLDVYKSIADQNGATDYKMILGNQAGLVKILEDLPILQQKSREGIVHMWIPDDGLKTHEKIYLLENSETGATRIITGSANASFKAWDGSQGEVRDVRDNDIAYDYYKSLFVQYKRLCSDVGKEARLVVDEDGNPDLLKLPISKKAEKMKNYKDGILIRETTKPDEAQIDYVVHMTKMAATVQTVGAVNIKPAKDGSVHLAFKTLIEASKRKMNEFQDKKQKRILSENPQFLIDYDNNTISFNGKQRDLAPDIEHIKADLENLNRIFEGFETFVTDRPDNPASRVYWRVLNFMFAAPFMPNLRNTAACNGVNKSTYLPGCCLVRGVSNAAKTKTVRAFQKMMLGVSPKPNTNKEFAEKYIRGARQELRGIPVIIDEVKGSRFKSLSGTCTAETIAKLYTENNGVEDLNPLNEPFFVATSNAKNFINVQTQKRMPVFTIKAHCLREQALESDDTYENIIKELTTSLYDAYCAKMLDAMGELLDGIRKPSEVGRGIDDADIYAIGSKIILSLYKDCGLTPPLSFEPLTWRDIIYVNTSDAEGQISEIYSRYPESIRIDRERNELVLDLSKFSKAEADYCIDLFTNEAPDMWRVKTGIGTEVIFTDLAAVEDKLNIRFTKKSDTSGVLAKMLRVFRPHTS